MSLKTMMEDFPWPELDVETRLESVRVFGVDLRVSDKVRLWPKKRGDIMDLAFQKKVATIEAIEQDFEGQIHLAVVLDDDPGRDLGFLRKPGHRFFFSTEEVEPMRLPDNQQESP
ncbi:hypothetical protein [Schlesneria paludicola]|uniref:hypothetical protein n=1 Tax=Schlesneria paludicola TaxID=360056 RepID=UPI0002F3D869|nr:hypothetical protein [Schlesneria paludicola]